VDLGLVQSHLLLALVLPLLDPHSHTLERVIKIGFIRHQDPVLQKSHQNPLVSRKTFVHGKGERRELFFFCIAVLFSFVQPNSQASGGSSPWLNPFYGLSWVESIGVFDCGGFGVGLTH
jgi:hypothetical protein